MSRPLDHRDIADGRPSYCVIMPFHISEGHGGGAEVQAWFLARELASRGFPTTYIAQSVNGKSDSIETIDGVTILWVRYARRIRWLSGLAYYRALSRANADIVIQRMTAFSTGIAALWCRRHRRKFVWICSDDAAPRKWMFLRAQRAANKSACVGFIKGIFFLLAALLTDLSRNWGMRRVWLAFTQNDTQKMLLKQDFGLDSKRMLSGQPIASCLLPLEERLSRPLVLWAAHLGVKKRPEKFIELAQLGKNLCFDFIMIGGHPDQSRIAGLFATIPKNLKWLGKLAFDETLTFFDRAAFFVNTSAPEGEGFPNTYIQAWLRGIPVLSLGVDPDCKISEHGLGIVNSDPAALLAYMIDLASNPSRYQRVSSSIKRFAEQNHSIEAMYENFIAALGSPAPVTHSHASN